MTGRSPFAPSISGTGAVPHNINIRVHNRQNRVDGRSNIVSSEVTEFSIPINSEDGNAPQWLEHPEHKFAVDVVAIRISNHLEFREKYTINVANRWKEYHKDYQPEAMADVFVIGYPWGLSSTENRGGGLPVYKKGCIASDPIIDFRRLPSVLIDCRTTSAMSGSPVIASQSGIFMPDGKISGNMALGTVSAFLGVYSGRLYDQEFKTGCGDEVSEIGIVWKSSVLEHITQEGSPGTKLRDLAK